MLTIYKTPSFFFSCFFFFFLSSVNTFTSTGLWLSWLSVLWWGNLANYEMLNYLKINIVYKKTEWVCFDFINGGRHFDCLCDCDLQTMLNLAAFFEQHGFHIQTAGVDLWTRKASFGCLVTFLFSNHLYLQKRLQAFSKTPFKAVYLIVYNYVPLRIQEMILLM